MHRITLRKMHRRHRAARERAMAQKLADVAQIPVAWASGLLVEEHQVTPVPAEPERAGLMQVLNAPEHVGRVQVLDAPVDGINRTERAENRQNAAVYLGAALGVDHERLLEVVKTDLALVPAVQPDGVRYLTLEETTRMSEQYNELHVVLAATLAQTLVDKALESQVPVDSALKKPALESEVVPSPAVEITKAEITDIEDDELEHEADASADEEDESDDDEDMSDEELDALERASDPSPQMTSPVAEAVLRAARQMSPTNETAPETTPRTAPVVYPPAPTGAICATCQEPAVHHVGYHDYCKRCTPTSLKRKAKSQKT